MSGDQPVLHTTMGPRQRSELGLILPHEHVFVDLRTPDHVGHGEAAETDVVALMVPQVQAALDVGVTALVECSTGGVGRRADLDLAVSRASGLPIVVPTGIYREPWVPDWARGATPRELEDWMSGELDDQIEGTGVRAAWIKVSAGDDGITTLEERILGAAAAASRRTGATIGSHSIRGRVARHQLDILERAGVPARRFIWIHTQAEPDHALHLELARRGAWLSYDDVGSRDDAAVVEMVRRVLDAGFGAQLLLSHDAGWFDPAQPGGGTPRGYTHLVTSLIPALRAAGVDDATVDQLTRQPLRGLRTLTRTRCSEGHCSPAERPRRPEGKPEPLPVGAMGSRGRCQRNVSMPLLADLVPSCPSPGVELERDVDPVLQAVPGSPGLLVNGDPARADRPVLVHRRALRQGSGHQLGVPSERDTHQQGAAPMRTQTTIRSSTMTASRPNTVMPRTCSRSDRARSAGLGGRQVFVSQLS